MYQLSTIAYLETLTHKARGDPTAETLDVSRFTLGELHERLDSVLNEGITGIVYSLKGYPSLAVGELQLDGLGQHGVDAIKRGLALL